MADWANAIPLVSAFAAVFSAGIVYSKVQTLRELHKEHKEQTKELIDEAKKTSKDALESLEARFVKSAENQGERLGELKAWTQSHDAVQKDRRTTAAHGVVKHEPVDD